MASVMPVRTHVLVTITFTLWWREDEPDRIMLNTGDPRFTEEDGTRPGLWITFSENSRSADYNPGNYNRFVRFLRGQGIAAPPEAPVRSRRLRDRWRLL
jgi:hypothetical protein